MIWILFAIIAHAGNALVFIVDKGLLGADSVISDPKRYAAYSGLVAAGAAIVLPFGFAFPTAAVVGWSLLAGVLWVAALWLFFIGLKGGEPSRVVPIAGSSVPLFTLLISALLLGEVLLLQQLAAVVLLIVGGALLSLRLGQTLGLSRPVLLATVLSGAAFAAYFVVVDVLYDSYEHFLAGFAYSRLGVGVVALLLLAFVARSPATHKKSSARRTGLIAVAFFGSKILAAGALLLQNYAISLGSVTIVNALQGTQYLAVLLLAILVSRFWPNIFREELSRVALWQKVSGITAVALGLILLVI